ncbi:uncharacterized protein SPAPADRAFT_153168 [Spathaspora passalidarum NRRL Y-27907]|uniref:Fibronectin type-III domain-containing protein n=1 Tax=Spathaspora passalidarum (strain NRRL Y-27907 / 11-Y1) TaxID=619300 RepID=G3AQ32_SPAPN|nr:uncharacterized protein SPAPADRAFT_153168 [Spathaspora passalidarum NRRL Y-27907]EGW32353.1 hypothetical protein SPAPADRAFT_153168 [Spathaspora passalidarum NRRL Y-27907]
MIEVLITLVPSLCWLLYRFYLILRTPVEKLVEDLNIEIPHTPTICIDSIAETSVVVHWNIEIRYDENLYYVLVINDREAATLTSTSCKLNNLSAKQVYQIQIVAINSITNFRSLSKPVFVSTFNKDDKELEFSKDVNFDEDIVENIITSGAVSSADDTSSSANDDESSLESITIDQIQSITSAELLNDYLSKFQHELVKVNADYRQFQQTISEEHEHLQQELLLYRHELEEESDNKVKKDQDVKSLERSKDVLTFQKSKLLNQVTAIKNSLVLFNTKFQENEAKIRKLQDRNQLALTNEEKEKSKINKSIASVQKSISKTKEENEKIEENLKVLLQERKESIALLNQIKPLVEVFNQAASIPATLASSTGISNTPTPPPILSSGATPPITASGTTTVTNQSTISSTPSIFNKDGSIAKPAFEALVQIFQIMPTWQDEIMHEINQYQELEQAWRDSFRTEIKKYVAVHQALEIAKHNLDKNYVPVKMNEYLASIEFGGFANALPRPRASSKRIFTPPIDESNLVGNMHNSGFFNHYGQVYTDSDSDVGQKVSPLFQQPQIVEPVVQPLQSSQRSINHVVGDFGGTDYSYPSPPQQQAHPYISLEQINAQTHMEMAKNTAGAPATSTTTNATTTTTTPPMQGFPYDDQIYTSSIAAQSPLGPTNQTQNLLSYGDYNSLLYRYNSPTLAPVNHEVWNQPATTNPGNSANTYGFLATPTSKLWSDSSSITGSASQDYEFGHNRTVSATSQIWRNEATPSSSHHNFNLGGVGSVSSGAEFQPFGKSIMQLSSSMNNNNNNNNNPSLVLSQNLGLSESQVLGNTRTTPPDNDDSRREQSVNSINLG